MGGHIRLHMRLTIEDCGSRQHTPMVLGVEMSDDEVKEEKELDLASCDVKQFIMCWRSSCCCHFLADVTEAIQLVVSECKPKAKIVDICEKGDAFIRD
ncbi:hypothetical protein IEQ34_009506 [Dendrobium chrysotoxum]|uniref:Uncharacterized protein n=1 Tax=Dendrobium chrysotoxum TaxID=161865 RepID=A0AAV7H0K5_DENCH|nr:hypothetical protein IEQ34_009506 [Dendrobium chrysotoxum]